MIIYWKRTENVISESFNKRDKFGLVKEEIEALMVKLELHHAIYQLPYTLFGVWLAKYLMNWPIF